jgi:3-deoxy-7-phosphoheptulonate synthase
MDIIVLKPGTKKDEITRIERKLRSIGLDSNVVIKGTERTIIGVKGDTASVTPDQEEAFRAMEGVESVVRITKPYKLASRESHKGNTVIRVGRMSIGGKRLCVMAGPCSVESRDGLLDVAASVARGGANFLRGGAFKPRTSPYAFQGMKDEGLKILAEASRATGLPVVSEVMDPRDIEVMERYVDVFQIGTRNMQNFRLLLEVGKSRKPVLLKRGLSATIKEWLMAAEYIMSNGNSKVILCERGIRTFETATRNTLDLSAIPVLKELTHLPVIVDPSHGVGIVSCVPAMAKAAVAAGADGLMLEVHQNPAEAMSDGDQSLKPDEFARLMKELKPVAKAVGRTI